MHYSLPVLKFFDCQNFSKKYLQEPVINTAILNIINNNSEDSLIRHKNLFSSRRKWSLFEKKIIKRSALYVINRLLIKN